MEQSAEIGFVIPIKFFDKLRWGSLLVISGEVKIIHVGCHKENKKSQGKQKHLKENEKGLRKKRL